MPITSLTPGQKVVLEAISNYKGIDDAGLAVHVHHIASNDMSSSGVRTRRVELERKGLVAPVGTHRTKSGRSAVIHSITSKGKSALAQNS